MASNYKEISAEHLTRYGTDVGRYGEPLLVERYDDRTHFIYELLQNAEDALKRRGEQWKGSRQVRFELANDKLVVSHNGHPFTEADVRSICSIAMSTKGDEAIGKFGIGFKSVYTFTDQPEIHSGGEDFSISDYVHPRALPNLARAPDETKIVLPLNVKASTAEAEITKGLKTLGPSALLFLRHVEEISWSIQGGESGLYLRNKPICLGKNVGRITVIGQSSNGEEVDQDWLVFHKDVEKGRVEIAFSLLKDKDIPNKWNVQPLASSPLVVFFPTIYQTNLGFLVQGPYLTTPSRDNITRGELWNHRLVDVTATLLVEAMRWLRDNAMLDTSALRCLPIDREKFTEGSLFSPLFDAVREALAHEEMLPRFDGGYVAAPHAKLARTQELRELFNSEQIASLYDSELSGWLSGDITQDRAPEIRQYVMRELGITEVTPATLIPRLNQQFLEEQSDGWIVRLYEFLSGQEAALRRRLDTVALVRLEDGSHVVAKENGRPNAFLPSSTETEFPKVRREVCSTDDSRQFLLSLGITEPDPVDDVIWNVLPRYQKSTIQVSEATYAADIERIRTAFSTDSKTQRDKLLSALRETPFVMVVDTGDGKRYIAKPGSIYIATDRLKQLFAGVPRVLIVNDEYDCLRGENLRELLEACGSLRYPRPIEAPNALTSDERLELRQRTGHAETSGYSDKIVDWLLQGFDALLAILQDLTPAQRIERARLIWESLGDLEDRRGRGIFDGSYSWSHYGERKTPPFPAAFLRRLNEVSWVPDVNGELLPAGLVVFDELGWKQNPFLQSKIAFKPPIIDQLAREAGIDPAALDLLRKLGITSVADLTSRLGIADQPSEPEPETETETDTESNASGSVGGSVYDEAGDLYGDDMPDIPAGTPDPDGGDTTLTGSDRGGQSRAGTGGAPGNGGQGNGGPHSSTGSHSKNSGNGNGPSSNHHGKRSPGQAGGRPFVSYVGTHPNVEASDPDGLDQAERMHIEASAIELIVSDEPSLHRTPDGNPGFDLYEPGEDGEPVRWVEVKAMSGSLDDRPVGISHTQFEYAQRYGNAYWLYVVENANDSKNARILRIQDPVSHAKTFTFDHGWREIAI